MAEHLTTMVVDRGGRAHALTRAHERSPQVEKVVVAPGNDFIALSEGKEVILEREVDFARPETIVAAARKHRVVLVEVAQDDALAAGTVDALEEAGIPAVGPTQAAARIESDKIWSYRLMEEEGIPQAHGETFDRPQDAVDYALKRLRRGTKRLWFKAPSLQAGKGALKVENKEEALHAAAQVFAGFREEAVLVSDHLAGEEFSYTALVDGEHIRYTKSAQDNKRLKDGDLGPNTGGMGANAPAFVTVGLEQAIHAEQMEPAVRAMAERGHPFHGVLYLGGIVLKSGELATVEFNARWGDPEAQVIVEGITSDYIEALLAIREGRLDSVSFREDGLARACLVLAAEGYPGVHKKAERITGMQRAAEVPDVTILGAGVSLAMDTPYTNGGRVLNVVGRGRDTASARAAALEAAEYVRFGSHRPQYRHDIAWRDIARLEGRL